MASIERKIVLEYLSGEIICPSKLTIFFELRPRKTVLFTGQMMFADKYILAPNAHGG